MSHYNVIAVTVLAVVALFASEAAACSCAPPEQPSQAVTDKAVASATAVFLGYPVVIRLEPVTVTLRERTFDMRTIAIVRTQFRVLRSWKGVDSPLVWITASEGRGCEYEFEIGRSYVVYAYGHSAALTTNTCSRTRPETDSIFEMERLGPPHKTFLDSDRIKW